MTAKRFGKKLLKITGIALGILIVLLTAFHFWFVHHAEEIIEELVASKSNGKLRLEVKKFRFNWLSKKMELVDAVFYSTDTAEAGTAYRFAVKHIKIKVTAVLPILVEKKVLINMLDLQDPDIVVTRLRSTPRDTLSPGKDISIPQEMGKIYNSIQDALNVLKVKKFQIENATFTLRSRIRPDEVPVTIGKIDFHIDNLEVDTDSPEGKQKIFFSDNIVLKSRDQDILLPDARHRISYRKFRINIESKIVEFDSCTISALPTDSSSSDFSVFFDALVMTNIDFDTLYRAEVIKADSVYCVNPKFKLNVDVSKKGRGIEAPKLDQIIRSLTGDLSLNFVVVNNASFDINSIRDGVPNSFTSHGNNFEMQGLRIDNDAVRPLQVEKFAMAIRNYENFLKDSMYALQFDSIVVNNDRIYLNNFSFQKRLKNKTISTFNVPRFQLTGLSWDDLLFQKKLTAQQATLYNPVIRFVQSPPKKVKKYRTIFEALASINDVLALEEMNIMNGDIDLRFHDGAQMRLKNATMSIESRDLLGSNQIAGIRRSVNYLDFNTGYLKIGDLTVLLDSIYYTGTDSKLNAGKVSVTNLSKSVNASLENVTMDEIFIDEFSGDVSISGIDWTRGNIKLDRIAAGKKKNSSFISLTDINGNNTKLSMPLGNGRTASVNVKHLGLDAFLLKPGEKPIVAGLSLLAEDLLMVDSTSRLSAATLTVKDKQNASLESFRYKKTGTYDSVDIAVPSMSFIPDVQSAISGEMVAGNLRIHKPVINVHFNAKEQIDVNSPLRLPRARIDHLFIEQPDIIFSQKNDSGIARITWKGSIQSDNSISLSGAEVGESSFSAKSLQVKLNNFFFNSRKGKTFHAGNGDVQVTLSDLAFSKPVDEDASWTAVLSSLNGKDFTLDSIGKKLGRFDIKTVQLRDLSVSSGSIGSVRKLLGSNKNFRIQQVTGTYADSVNRFGWHNIVYDKGRQVFSLDSFSYSPTMDRDEFVANSKYQSDYIHIRTGAIKIGPFDIESYLQDSIVRIGMMQVDNILFDDYRDNRLPFKSGIIKPLMADRLKNLPFKLSVDTVLFSNANVTYSEVNPKTNLTGIIHFNRMNMRVFPVRNFDHGPTDSLRIHADGYLMDSIWVRLRLKQSYIDSLSGFLLTVRMKPADVKVLNPVLVPLASAKLRSGFLDTLSMRVAGQEYLAFGEMKLFYHDLKLELYKPGTTKRNGFLTFLANGLLIRHKNTKRTGSVFFERNRERSAINYLIKMVMAGVKPAIGIKGNKKIMRQYKKELRERNLPPVDYD